MESRKGKGNDYLSKFIKNSPHPKVAMPIHVAKMRLSKPNSPTVITDQEELLKRSFSPDTHYNSVIPTLNQSSVLMQMSNKSLDEPKLSFEVFKPIVEDAALVQLNQKNKLDLKESINAIPQQNLLTLISDSDSKLVSILRNEISEARKSTVEMQSLLVSSKAEFEQRTVAILKDKEASNAEIKILKEALEEKNKQLCNLQQGIDAKCVNDIKNELDEVSQRLTLEANQPALVKTLIAESSQLKSEKSTLIDKYSILNASISKERETHTVTANTSATKISNLQSALSDANNKILKLESEKAQLNEEIILNQKIIKGKEDEINHANDKIKTHVHNEERLKEITEKFTSMMQQYTELSINTDQLIAKSKAQIEQMLSKTNEQANTIISLEQTQNKATFETESLKNALRNSNTMVQGLKLELANYKSQVSEMLGLQKKCDALDQSYGNLNMDYQKALWSYNNLNEVFNAFKSKSEKLTNDNDALIIKYNEALDENQRINKQILSAYDNIGKLRERLAILKAKFEEAQKYVAVPDDPIDLKLAEEINKRILENHPIEIPFIRHSKGTYTFGTTKALLKLEFDSLIVRVGGGYSPFESFLTVQIPIELEKLKRSDPLRVSNSKNSIIKSTLKMFDEEGIMKDSPTAK